MWCFVDRGVSSSGVGGHSPDSSPERPGRHNYTTPKDAFRSPPRLRSPSPTRDESPLGVRSEVAEHDESLLRVSDYLLPSIQATTDAVELTPSAPAPEFARDNTSTVTSRDGVTITYSRKPSSSSSSSSSAATSVASASAYRSLQGAAADEQDRLAAGEARALWPHTPAAFTHTTTATFEAITNAQLLTLQEHVHTLLLRSQVISVQTLT